MKILITGGTGFIGQKLGQQLALEGHELFVISRSKARAELELSYPATIIEHDLNEKRLLAANWPAVDTVVHLMGENVGSERWTEERKAKILSSRKQATENLMTEMPSAVKTFVAASAIGYYGDTGNELVTEKSQPAPGNEFLRSVCEQWEASVQSQIDEKKRQGVNLREVILRIGVVLGFQGGALKKMLPIFRSQLGAPLGSGEQWMSWIHLKDLVSMLKQSVLNSKYQGLINAVAPQPVTNRKFTELLCEQLSVLKGPAVPALALKVTLGEMAEMVLSSQKVSSQKVSDLGFQFEFPELEVALSEILSIEKTGDEVFYVEQYLDIPIEKTFEFFAEAKNLEAITPPLLNFSIEKMSTESIQEGTLIDYKLKIHGVPASWQTLIKEWNPPFHFIDEQLKGPYTQWVHLHRFQKMGRGTLMTDLVRYRMPLGILGKVVAGRFVRSDIEQIFDYRRKTVPALIRK
jgi:uncharacterized protein (TIGR01777 family)